MSYEEFIEAVKEGVQALNPERSMRIETVLKNNDISLRGITMTSDKNSIMPAIYLEDYYEKYANGISLEYICNDINTRLNRDSEIIKMDDFKFIYNFEEVKQYLKLIIINKERNKNRLSTIPFIEYLDEFALVPVIFVDVPRIKETANIYVNDKLLDLWDTDKNLVFKIAYENIKHKDEVSITSLNDKALQMYKEMLKYYDEDDTEEVKEMIKKTEDLIKMGGYDMYVITNTSEFYGANQVLVDSTIEKLRSIFNGDFFLLPSSIHEWIAVKKDDIDVDTLRNIVNDVNSSELDYKELLSDEVFLYDYTLNRIFKAE